MNIFSDLFFLQRVDYLIRTRATGSPEKLASRLGVSERNVYRLINELKCQGFPIAYDKQANTYYYSEQVKIDFSIVVGKENLLVIRGGDGSADFSQPAGFWQSCDSPLDTFPYHAIPERSYPSEFMVAL